MDLCHTNHVRRTYLCFWKQLQIFLMRAHRLTLLTLTKAFDKVPHRCLLAKMASLGIKGKLFQWIEAWLKNIEQRTVLNGSSSGWAEVLSGVPQGSVLGPLLFVVFINDLDNCKGNISIMLKFSDDAKLIQGVASQNDIALLRNTIHKLIDWAEHLCIHFKVSKCKVLHVSRNDPKQVL